MLILCVLVLACVGVDAKVRITDDKVQTLDAKIQGRVLRMMDNTQDPCENSVQYMCGKYLATPCEGAFCEKDIPGWSANMSAQWSFNIIADAMGGQQKDVITGRYPFIGVWFDGCMDTAGIESGGWAAFNPAVKTIFNGIQPDSQGRMLDGLELTLGKLQRQGLATSSFFSGSSVDQLTLISGGKLGSTSEFYAMSGQPVFLANQLCTYTAAGLGSAGVQAGLEVLYASYKMDASNVKAMAHAICQVEIDIAIAKQGDPACKQPADMASYVAMAREATPCTRGSCKAGFDLDAYVDGLIGKTPSITVDTIVEMEHSCMEQVVHATLVKSLSGGGGNDTVTKALPQHYLLLASALAVKDQLPSAFGKALAQTSVVGRMPLLALPTEPIVAEVQPRHAKLSSWNSNVKNAKPTRTKTKLTFDRLTAFERMAETLKPTPIIDFERLQRTHLRAAAVLAGDRNAQCGASTQSTFPDFFSREWVQLFWPEGSKGALQALSDNIYGTMGEVIKDTPWLDNTTRAAATAKYSSLKANVAFYDDAWYQYRGVVADGIPVSDAMSIASYKVMKNLQAVGQVINRNRFGKGGGMSAMTINAFYDPTHNNINLLPGLAQEPFFSPDLPMMLNIASYGMVVGHEITHGFDNNGRLFNGFGNYTDWWTADSLAEFDKRTECMIAQYSGYKNEYGDYTNGTLTLGENIADNGGIHVAYRSYEKLKASDPNTNIQLMTSAKEITNDQLFFIYLAQDWCQKLSKADAEHLITADVHSPGLDRIRGPMSNFPDYATAFKCSADTPMGKSKTDKRCYIW